jgi:hypothetical protein
MSIAGLVALILLFSLGLKLWDFNQIMVGLVAERMAEEKVVLQKGRLVAFNSAGRVGKSEQGFQSVGF